MIKRGKLAGYLTPVEELVTETLCLFDGRIHEVRWKNTWSEVCKTLHSCNKDAKVAIMAFDKAECPS